MPATRKARPQDDEWVSLPKAAKLLQTNRQTLLTRAIKGELEAKHVAGRTVLSRASVERVRKAEGLPPAA